MADKIVGGFQWLADSTTGDPSGLRRPSDGREFPFSSLVSGAGIPILNAATAGQDSGWFDYVPGMRLAYALDSGTTSTNLSLDMSVDGSTSVGQYGTDTWASSTTTKITQPIWLTNVNVRKLRLNVLTGGPISAEARI